MANDSMTSTMQLNPVLYKPKGNIDYLRIASIVIVVYAGYSIFSLMYQQGIIENEIQSMMQQEKVAQLQLQQKKQNAKAKALKLTKPNSR